MRRELSPFEVLSLYPRHDYTLQGLFDSRACAGPERPCLLFEGRTWSWAELGKAIADTAAMLHERGIAKGDRVGMMAVNSPVQPVLLFALARIGAILVPVNPEFGVAEARYVLHHAGVSAVVCSRDKLEVVTAAIQGVERAPWLALVDGATGEAPNLWDTLARSGPARLPPPPCAEDTCAIIYSSGTTGFPKGVMHSQQSFVLTGEIHVARTRAQPDERTLCVLPMFHVNALFYSLAGSIACGGCLVVAARFSASTFWRLAAETGATQVNIMAAISTILARRPRSEFVASHRLRLVYGAPFTQEAMDVLLKEFGVERVIEGYGMTEIPGALSVPYDGPYKLASMGKPDMHPDPARPWTEARIVDDAGRELPDGATGELAVRIPSIMQGYFRDPEQTAAAFRDGWFLTGDLARRDADGYYAFVARKKDIIRRRSENIAGAELDRVMAEHPGVAEVAAIAVDSDLGEDDIMAVVVAKSGARLTAEEIAFWCRERLAPHKVPRYVVFVDALPHTPTHKVAKHVLKEDTTLRARSVDLQGGRA
ncbi:MAG: AMP-binding protein [Burkholderiales bacterium]|nr:AMP-binding protein [Burkholderiales bacterium]